MPKIWEVGPMWCNADLLLLCFLALICLRLAHVSAVEFMAKEEHVWMRRLGAALRGDHRDLPVVANRIRPFVIQDDGSLAPYTTTHCAKSHCAHCSGKS